jgi:hypothetical protein
MQVRTFYFVPKRFPHPSLAGYLAPDSPSRVRILPQVLFPQYLGFSFALNKNPPICISLEKTAAIFCHPFSGHALYR